eukprot:Sspe_Gene.61144::Locus_33852_Transcript_1_1_Confidence_1.000_Length_378::g.61144::m.61144
MGGSTDLQYLKCVLKEEEERQRALEDERRIHPMRRRVQFEKALPCEAGSTIVFLHFYAVSTFTRYTDLTLGSVHPQVLDAVTGFCGKGGVVVVWGFPTPDTGEIDRYIYQ